VTRDKIAELAEAMTFVQNTSHESMRLNAWIKRTENDHTSLPQDIRAKFPDSIWQLLENDIKYEGYVQRQEMMLEKTSRMEEKEIPANFDYTKIHGLKKEAYLRLSQIRPATLGQATRIQGVTPADIALLAVMLRKG
jgi:tRNA uridine 5-carboxymethylaminomethyl modification enzyme